MAYFRAFRDPLAVIIDSTNGMLDGQLSVLGIEVYRADPWHLPDRPPFASVPAGDIAAAARQGLASLAKLTVEGGTLTGRTPEALAGIEASAAMERALTLSGRCGSHGSRAAKVVALSFDDGPNPPYTNSVLDVLSSQGAVATFFCVGMHASAHREVMARIRDEGHEVANHTWSHPFLPDLTYLELREQIERTTHVLGTTGSRVLFRPPYGSRTPEVMRWLDELGVTIALWDVEPFDWARPGAEAIADRVLSDVRPGSIILMHDGGGDRSQTVAALPTVIQGLRSDGYAFATVTDLLGRQP